LLAATALVSVLACAGTIWAAVIPGTPGNDALRGTARADSLYGKGGNDGLLGLAGNDLLVGGPGNDRLTGGPGNDRLTGGPGNDRLTGGPGSDRLSCGGGRDTANADAKDRVGADCESVKGIPEPTPEPQPEPIPQPEPPHPPGQKIDVGGYSLYIECAGSGSPTVILETGGPSASLEATGWMTMRAGVAAETRVCAYDRAGLGQSDARPVGVARTGATLANELQQLLAKAQIPGPYVLYGSSLGGLITFSHTLRLPSEVAGLILENALGPEYAAVPIVQENLDFRADAAQLLNATLEGRPLVVLDSDFTSDGAALARRSTNSILVNVRGAGHFIAGEKPQLVVEAIRLVVTSVRTGGKLPPCAQTALPSRGGSCG
jgi:pimeloyl-ACP methyl ester carboxylesterase